MHRVPDPGKTARGGGFPRFVQHRDKTANAIDTIGKADQSFSTRRRKIIWAHRGIYWDDFVQDALLLVGNGT